MLIGSIPNSGKKERVDVWREVRRERGREGATEEGQE